MPPALLQGPGTAGKGTMTETGERELMSAEAFYAGERAEWLEEKQGQDSSASVLCLNPALWH